VDSIREIRDAWRKGERYLQERLVSWKRAKNQEGIKIVNQIFDALAILRWSDKLCGFSANAVEGLDSLTYYTSNKWLAGEHVNQMLDLLRLSLQRQGKTDIEILSTYFYNKISRGFDNRDQYTQDKSFHVHCRLGNDLAVGISNEIAFLVNLNQNHWVSVIVNFRQHEILYGDSLGPPISLPMKNTLLWWTRHHTDINFTLSKLPITIQGDSFSCGLLAWNSLVAYFGEYDDTLVLR
jgi:hypothetical protein